MADRFKELQCFLAVRQFGNFTRAAEAMGMSQPSLSAIISNFEEDLGLLLFDRTTRSVEMTAAGERLYPRAAQIVNDLADALDGMRATSSLATGSVKIAALPSVCSGLLPQALNVFHKSHPKIEVNFCEVLAGPMAEMVVSGECEFAIGVDFPTHAELDFGVILSDEMLLICAQDHRFSAETSLPWEALSGEPMVSMGSMTSIHGLIKSVCTGHDIDLKIAHTALFLATAFGLVREGLGVSVMPRSLLVDFSMKGIAAIPMHTPQVKRHVGIIQRRSRSLSPAAVELAKVIRDVAAQNEVAP